MNRRRSAWVSLGAALLCVGTLATGPASAASLADTHRAPSVRVSIVRAKESNAQRVVLVLRVDGAGLVLGSYEGRVQFDPTVLAVDSAVAGRDGSRFVNSGDAVRGTIRFAGFTPTGFINSDAVRIVGRVRGRLENAKVVATLAVAGDLDGKSVPKTALIGATTIDEVR